MYWILKTEPTSYSYQDLVAEGRTVWDGVKNPVALKNIRQMKSGDKALIYHTGKEKSAVGLANVVSDPYPDPERNDEKLVVVDIEPAGELSQPVTLATIKSDPAFAEMALVRQGRLSVVPATAAQWRRLLALAKA